MNKLTLALGTVALLSLGVAVAAVSTGERAPGAAGAPAAGTSESRPRHVAILLDRSDSMEDGSGSSCEPFLRLVDKALALEGVTTASNVRGFLTGNGVGQHLPPLGDAIRVPVQEGGEMVARDTLLRVASLRQAGDQCRAGIAQLQVSPIYASVRAALDVMRVEWGCGADHPCTLLVRSDLQETNDRPTRAAIKAKPRELETKLAALEPLDTTGIDTWACGTQESGERLSTATVENTEAAWSRLVPGMRVSPVCL